MSDSLTPEQTADRELEETLRRRLKDVAKKGMIVFLPAGDVDIKNIGQPIKMPTSVPQAAAGPLDATVTTFSVVVNAPEITVPTTVYAKSLNADFKIQGSDANGVLKLTFDPATVDEPLLFGVDYQHAAPVDLGTTVDVSFYSDAAATIFLQNEVVSYKQIAEAISPYPRKLTILKIENNKVTLRWRVHKIYGSSYNLNVTYTDINGNHFGDLYQVLRGKDAMTPVPQTVKSTEIIGKFELTNVSRTTLHVIVSVVSPQNAHAKASMQLVLTP